MIDDANKSTSSDGADEAVAGGLGGPPEADRTQTIGPRERNPAVADTEIGGPTPGNTPRTPSGARGTPTWSAALRGSAEPLPMDDPERYAFAGEHARGGLGRVVKAVDTRLRRTVAIKELLKKSDLAETLFVREALITARLQHPGIVPVHEAGRWPSGEPYYVMKLVSGRTLKELIAQRPTLTERLALLPHAIALAEAIGYAHSESVIHRDIKPSNVVIGEFGETVVVDWGLARDGKQQLPGLDAELAARLAGEDGAHCGSGGGAGVTPPGPTSRGTTVSGRVIGTPAYMPPEQARGDTVDERADVYAIGAVLYEILAGEPPYAGADSRQILTQVLAGPPIPLERRVPDVGGELAAVVAKAMARYAVERYPTAKELAEDLKRFQTGQLVTAQKYTAVKLLRRWIARHRAAVIAAAAALAVIAVMGVLTVRRIVDERNVAQVRRTEAQRARRAAESRQQELLLLQARTSVNRDPTAALAWLKAFVRPGSGGAPAISPEQVAWIDGLADEATAQGVARHVIRHDDWVLAVAFSPDGSRVASGARNGEVRLTDPVSGEQWTVGNLEGGVEVVSFSLDGKQLMAGGSMGAIVVWDLASGRRRDLLGHRGAVGLGAFCAGNRLFTLASDRTARIWNLATGEVIIMDAADVRLDGELTVGNFARDGSAGAVASLDGKVYRLPIEGTPHFIGAIPGPIAALAASNDGAGTIVARDNDGAMWVFIDDAPPRRLGIYPAAIEEIAFSRDRSTIAVVGLDPAIYLWDLATGKPTVLRGHQDSVYRAIFSADGKRLASSSDDGSARIWSLESGTVQVLRGHEDDVYRIAWSPDERTLATASLDRAMRIWTIDDDASTVLIGHKGGVGGAVYGPGGELISYAYDGEVRSWDAATDASRVLGTIGHGGPRAVRAPQVSRDGRYVAALTAEGELHLWDRTGGTDGIVTAPGRVSDYDLARGGGALAVRYFDQRHSGIAIWNPATRTSHTLIEGKINGMSWLDDGTQLVVGLDGRALVLDADTGATLREMPLPGCDKTMTVVAPDASRAAFSHCMHEIVVWTFATDTTTVYEVGNHTAVALAFSADGNRLAAAMSDRSVKLWDLRDGSVRTLTGHTDLVMSVAFSPDGQTLASSSYDRTIRLWDLQSRAVRVLRGHDGSIDWIAFRPDGRELASASRDQTVRRWPIGPPLPASAQAVRARLDAATTAVIGPEDRPVTLLPPQGWP